MIPFRCDHCGKDLKVKDELAGKKVKCPGCQKPVGVPQLAASVSPPPNERDERTLPPKASSAGEERNLPPKEAGKKESISDAGGLTDLGAGKRETTQAFPATEHSSELTDFLAPPQKPDEIGRLGPFRVLKVLGHGGMGVVYKAEDPDLERPVALKAMLPTLAASESARQRFLREAKAAATVVHDHIVPIHQVGEDRGVPFIAMQFLEGEPLDDRVKREGRFPVAEVLRIGRETAEGLAAAHEKGLIHRDIKPANIWLEGKKARVKILDFGLARAAAEQAHLTQSGAIIGTPAFMAPEQAQAKPVDQRCDLFSLGCVLYRMGTGKPPFIGADTITTLMAVVTENPVPPRDLNEGVPQSLSDLVMQLLAKNPDDRPQSAQAVVQALQKIEMQTPDTTVQPGQKTQKVKVAGKTKTEAVRMQTASATKKRLPLPWLVGGGVLGLGLLVLGIVLFWQTPHGTVKIESDDPDIEIVFDKTGPTIKGAGKEPISLRAGEHGILVKRGDFEFGTDKLVIKKGETITLKIEMLGGKMQLVQDGKVLAAKEMSLAKTFKNTLGMEFVLVPKGKSWLGGGGGKPGDEEVEIKEDFYLGKYEVTQEEWEKVTGINPATFKAVPGVAKDDQKQFPVEMVSWEDAQVFIQRLNKQVKDAGWVYRLPKEMEWEYACRGGPGDKFDSGFDFYLEKPTNQLLPEHANFDHGKRLTRTCKVGSYPANRLGLYDMHGNVWEWCADEVKDAKGASRRVSRGGSWSDDAGHCRAANRTPHPPSGRSDYLGVRLARVPVGKEIVKTIAADSADSDRRAAEWVLSVGGIIHYRQGGGEIKIKALADLPRGALELTFVDLKGNPQASDSGLACFKGCKNLIQLQLNGTKVSDDGLANFKDCTRLAFLYLGNTQLTNAGLAHFKDCKDLKILSVHDTKVTDAGLERFKDCKNLGQLQISGTPVTDAGLVPFKDCNIERLLVGVTQVSDAGLAQLANWSGLRLLGIKKTKVTEAGVKKLAAALPSCKIEWDGGAIEPRTNFANSLGMEFVLVPKGKSWLGGGGGKPGDKEVMIEHDFYLGKYEVTQEEWQKVMGGNPSLFSRTGMQKDAVKDIPNSELQRFPVEQVSWDDAQLFLKLLNAKEKETGWLYRLPKEAEWEYACRGGPLSDKRDSVWDYYFDKPTAVLLPEQANFEHGKGLKRTCKVGSYQPNRLGLYDMHGNVQEWCDDATTGGDGALHRAYRGGGWTVASNACRAASSYATEPSNRSWGLGLRLARVPVGKEIVKIIALDKK